MKKKRSIITEDKIREINRLYNKNLGVDYVAKKLCLDKLTVKNHLYGGM